MVGGSDGHITFYDEQGQVESCFDYGHYGDMPRNTNETCSQEQLEIRQELTSIVTNPSGDTVIFGSWNYMFCYYYRSRPRSWVQAAPMSIKHLHAVTTLSWKCDGTRLAAGSLFGAVDLFDACIRRYLYKGRFELTFSSLSQVVVRRLSDGSLFVLKSLHRHEINKINIYQDRYVVANAYNVASATETLLLGDITTAKLSEVPWINSGNEKFVFDYQSCCVVHHDGELCLVEYGSNEVLARIRTDFASGHLVSLRLIEQTRIVKEVKRVAYLVDAQSISVRDLLTGTVMALLHDVKIDWLELSHRATLLLFRDKRHQLHLYNLVLQFRVTLLRYCTYVQWVPDSDVVVAQSRCNLCVWYNINAPDQVTLQPIRGHIVDIERRMSRTEVIVDEHITTASYQLDEALINFGTSLGNHTLASAVGIMEELETTQDAGTMWTELGKVSSHAGELTIAERCAAALGNISRTRHLHKATKLYPTGCDMEPWTPNITCDTKTRILHVTDDPLGTTQFNGGNAAQHTEVRRACDGSGIDAVHEVELHLKAGMPARAAQLISRYCISGPVDLLEKVAASLSTVGLHERAGEMLVRIGHIQLAMDSFSKANAFRRAVDLARIHFPAQVVALQESWGNYLQEHNQVEMAINHFIEASLSCKAIEAAVSVKDWNAAANLLAHVDTALARPYFVQLADHFLELGDMQKAEENFMSAGLPDLVVEMYAREKLWEQARRVAQRHLAPHDLKCLYITLADKLEKEGKLEEAQVLYLSVDEPDLAINMLKMHRKYEAMILLVKAHRSSLLKETHQFLGRSLEADRCFQDAENHYCEASEWLCAVNMYRANDMWLDAIRVATANGGVNASKRVAYAWALSLGSESGGKMLIEQGLLEPAIDFAVDSGAFEYAQELARSASPRRQRDVHLKHALYLEDEERYNDAELEFINAGKPREAIDMYIHQQAWSEALTIAAKHDPAAAGDIYTAQARVEADSGSFQRAEELYVLAGKPESALSMYKSAERWTEALSLAQRHLPHHLADVTRASSQAELSASGSVAGVVASARQLEQQKNWPQAIQVYLGARSKSEGDEDITVSTWRKAVTIARQHLSQTEYRDVVHQVIEQMKVVSKWEAAADLHYDLHEIEAAVDCAVEGRCWAKAKEIAVGNTVLERKLRALELGTPDSAEILHSGPELGSSNAALDDLAQHKDWTRLWDMADRGNLAPVERANYAGLQASQILADGQDAKDAVQTLLDHGAPPFAANVKMYEEVVTSVLGLNRKQESEDVEAYCTVVHKLKEVLFSVETTSCEMEAHMKYEDMRMTAHYLYVYLRCIQEGLRDLATKAAITLVHYSGIIPCDKAFFLAGNAARDEGHTNLAFILLNRYLDLSDAIADNSMNTVDNADFLDAERVPYPLQLPDEQYVLDAEAREDIRDWVLSTCMDTSVDQRLPPKVEVLGTIYAGLYEFELPACVVTGFPVQAWESICIKDMSANKARDVDCSQS